MVKNMLRKYLKTVLYPDVLEKVNKTLKMQMKENVVIYPSRTSLGGEKETVKRLGYNYIYLSNISFFLYGCVISLFHGRLHWGCMCIQMKGDVIEKSKGIPFLASFPPEHSIAFRDLCLQTYACI